MGPGESTIYCIDTSSVINLHRWRPQRRHGKVWNRLDELIDAKRLIAPRQVFGELRRGADALVPWAGSREATLFRRVSPEFMATVQGIVRRFPEFVDRDRREEDADPYVVALARQEHKRITGDQVIVVTDEVFG